MKYFNVVADFRLIIIVVLAFMSGSCDNELDIKDHYIESYSLDCIIDVDAANHVAYITKSFFVEDYKPADYDEDVFVKNARVTLFDDNGQYFFEETQIDSLPGFDKGYPISVYMLYDYTPTEGAEVSILATLEDGTRLRSSQTLVQSHFGGAPFMSKVIPSMGRYENEIEFDFNRYIQDFYFIPRLTVAYVKEENPEHVIKEEIPMNYIELNGNLEPVYPGISGSVKFDYYRDILEYKLLSISEGDSEKENYIFNRPELTMVVMDKELARLVSSERSQFDNYSVVVSKRNYTNIEGGMGLFCSYVKIVSKLAFNQEYIEGLGYQYHPTYGN